eukprot:771286-Amphidinium_carterae.1
MMFLDLCLDVHDRCQYATTTELQSTEIPSSDSGDEQKKRNGGRKRQLQSCYGPEPTVIQLIAPSPSTENI